MQTELSGKVVLITGAGKGTGRLLAGAFAAQGAIVAANDISPINVDEVVAKIVASGGQARSFVHDIAKKVALQSMVNEVADAFGRIDILVNCANVAPSMPLLDMDEWELHRIFEVNAIGAFLAAQIVGRVMRAQGGGIIIETATKAQGRSVAAYESSRVAALRFVESAAEELKIHNISLYGVAVGLPVSVKERVSYNVVEAVMDFCRGKYSTGTVLGIDAEVPHG